jgi:hypothetical protein
MSQSLHTFPGLTGSGALAAQRNRVLRNTYAFWRFPCCPPWPARGWAFRPASWPVSASA